MKVFHIWSLDRAPTNYSQSDILQVNLKDKAIAEKDNWLIEPSKYGESRLDDLKLYCKVDFLIPFEGKIFILDWKTGKKDGSKYSNSWLDMPLGLPTT